MVITLKPQADREELEKILNCLQELGLRTCVSEDSEAPFIGVIGDTAGLDDSWFRKNPIVESVRYDPEPYFFASRKLHPHDAVITVGSEQITRGNFTMIAGPCSVESREQIMTVAKAVKAAGATLLRGGAFKPRTSPYEFQGLREEGIRLLLEAGRAVGLPVVTEIVSIRSIPLFEDVDVVQVGARNMQNYDLLRELGRSGKTVLLKRGFANTVDELLMSAEYIMASGSSNVILCERGIRTFETSTRNTLDLSAVPVLHERTQLPVIVDPSHAAGAARYIKPMSLAAAAIGADGLMIEVHNDPPRALSDGPQALLPEQYADVARSVRAVRAAIAE